MLGLTARTFAEVVDETGRAAIAPPRLDGEGEESDIGRGRGRGMLVLLLLMPLLLPLLAGTAIATGRPDIRLRESCDGDGSDGEDMLVLEEEAMLLLLQLEEFVGSPNRLCIRFAPVIPWSIALFIRLLLLFWLFTFEDVEFDWLPFVELEEPEFIIEFDEPMSPPLVGADDDSCGTSSCAPFPPVGVFPEAAELGRELSREVGLLGGSFGGEEEEPSRSFAKSPSEDDALRLSMCEYGERLPRLGRPVGGRPLWSFESIPKSMLPE
jgi:hypothetical protein